MRVPRKTVQRVDSGVTSYRLQSANPEYKLLDDISYLDFLNGIPPTWVPGESPNRENISTLRLLVQLPIFYLDGVTLEIAVCVKVPHYLTAPLLCGVLRRWSNRQLEPTPTATVRAMVFWVARPPLVLGDGSDDDFLQRLALGNRSRDKIRDGSVANADLLFVFVDDFSSQCRLSNCLPEYVSR